MTTESAGAAPDPTALFNYPICKESDMPEDMKEEVIEICVTAAEKYSTDYELASKVIKTSLDKRFGAPFNVVIGESFSFYVTFQVNSMLLMYSGGNVAVLVWRTVATFG